MKKKIISTVLFSAATMLVGIILIMSAFAASGFDFNAFNGNKIEHEQFTVDSKVFNEIEIDSDTVDVEIIIDPTADKTYVDFYQDASVFRNVKQENGKLTVESGDRPWYKNIGIFWGNERLTVTLPTTAQGKVNIETDTGDVKLGSLVPETLSVSTDTGDISCGTVAAGSISIETDTGDVSLRDVTSTGAISVSVDTGDVMINSTTASALRIETTTGDVEIAETVTTAEISIATDTGDVDINGADSPDIYIHTSTGDVEAVFYTGKAFDIDTSTGDKRVPPSDSTGGKCRIITSTGDIEVDIRAPK